MSATVDDPKPGHRRLAHLTRFANLARPGRRRRLRRSRRWNGQTSHPNQPGERKPPDPGAVSAGTAGTAGAPAGRRCPHGIRSQLTEAAAWVVLVACGAAVTAALSVTGVDLATSAPPFTGRWEIRPTPLALLAVAVAAATLVAASHPVLAHARWPVVIGFGYLAALAWTLALGAADEGGLAVADHHLATASAIADNPFGYLDRLTEPHRTPTPDIGTGTGSGSTAAGPGTPAHPPSTPPAHPPSTPPAHPPSTPPTHPPSTPPTHPPGPALLVWALTRLGLGNPVVLGVTLSAAGAATLPLVATAVRSLCHEPAARRLVPVLALAPWAAWANASPDAVTATVAAAGVAAGVIGSEPGRRGGWALLSGVLLGVTALFGYGAVWLGTAVAATYFVRRRPALNAITGLGALLPLFAFHAMGFTWPDGLRLARFGGTGWSAWLALDLVVVVVVCGPVGVRAARRVRDTPGWPFLVGAAAAAAFAVVGGLAHGGVESSWLALFPWLLVPAVAPRPRPAARGDTVRAGEMPTLLVAAGAAAAVALQVALAPAPF